MASSPQAAPTLNQTSPPPPPQVARTPPQNASPPPPQSTTSPSPPPPAASSNSPPPPTHSQSPSNNTGASPPSTNSPPPPRNGSSSQPAFSPPPPGRNNSEAPPSRDTSRSPPSRSSQTPPPPSSFDDPSSSDTNTINAGVIAAIVVGGLLIIALLIVSIMCMRRKKKRPQYYIDPERTPKGNQYYNGNVQWNSPRPADHAVKLTPPPGAIGGWGTTPPPPPPNASTEYSSMYMHQTPMPPSHSPSIGGFGSQSQFSYEELASATGGFAQANLLGQGGFGLVHKGVLSSGKEVAVKSLKSGSGQGEREFQAEVEIISRVHHRHLVSLVGYCIAGGQKMLVYEFVPNNTLEYHLHGQAVMDWTTRLRIALGSAKGLAYLHEDCHPRIIHRDIKAANILIDSNFEAMVADFGLAKLTTDNHTHVSTRVMGTFGYLAPEYASSGKLSEKSDVFSFGVMLLELITGRRPVDPHNVMEDSLVDWAKPLLTRAQQEGIYEELVDPRLEGKFVVREMARMVACAAASIRHSARRRPKMSQIVRALEGDYSLDALSELGEQGPGVTSTQTSDLYDTRTYDADMMKFRKMVMMSSQEFNSSDYGATSEYGLNPSSSSDSSGKQTPEVHKH